MIDGNYSLDDERVVYETPNLDANALIRTVKGGLPGTRKTETSIAEASNELPQVDVTREARLLRQEFRPTCEIVVPRLEGSRKSIPIGVCLDKVLVSGGNTEQCKVLATPGWWDKGAAGIRTLDNTVYLHLWYAAYDPRNTKAENHGTDHAMITMVRRRYQKDERKEARC